MAAVVPQINPAVRAPEVRSPEPSVSSRPVEILVVDSDPDTVDRVRSAANHAVRVCYEPDTYRALYHVESAPVDLVVLELCLPGASGVVLLERLRARGFRVPVVVFSHAHGSESALRALGVSAVLRKDASADVLGDTIAQARLLAGRHLRLLP